MLWQGMTIYQDLLNTLQEGDILDVRIGLHWTAVTAEVGGQKRCGLSSTLAVPHGHGGKPNVPQAGSLTSVPGQKLARLVMKRELPTLASVGMATINALLPRPSSEMLADGNAEHILASRGRGKKTVVVGHFPFTNRLKSQIEELVVLDEHPVGDDLPAEAATQIVPEAEIVAITGMTLTNHTLEGLLRLCSSEALVLIIGPTTPLSPILFDYGVDMLCGSVVTAVEPVLQAVSQGGNFPQVHRAGVRLVTFTRSNSV